MSHIPGKFEISPDFDNTSYERIFTKVRSRFVADSHRVLPAPSAPPHIFTEFAGGWNAVKVRFEACTDYNETFSAMLAMTGVNPPPPERFTQDHELFVFFLQVLRPLKATITRCSHSAHYFRPHPSRWQQRQT